jgi:hypothetical protein
MRRWVLSVAGVCLAVMAAGGTGASLASAWGAAGNTPRVAVRALICHSDRIPTARWASVTATMGSMPQTQKMQLKFDLWESANGSPMTRTHGKNLGVWLSPKDPTLGQRPNDVWNFTKYVFGIDAPATYQFRVSFRWLGSDGKVLSATQRASRRCSEHQGPDLMVVSPIKITPTVGHPDEDTYTAVIRNGGGSAAGPFKVGFLVPNTTTEPPPVTIQQLRAHAQRTVSFVGPLCSAAAPPEIIVDTLRQVPDDFNPANNSQYATCPASNGG